MIGRAILGRYEIQRLLGEGGMGKVYLAKQTDLGRQVVVKVMHEHIAQDSKFRERFQRETLLMARFHHPFAVTLYDASLNDPGGPCIVMEYVKGGNLEDLLHKAKKMTAPRVGRIIVQLCDVLYAAHNEGIIHRDLKPANLMVIEPDTPKERIKVMDFGLAKLIDTPARQVTDTSVDFAVGTPAYICPEQVRGEPMDHRGDLYSVGVIMYELLSGKVPFHGTSSMDVLLAHATEEPLTFKQLGLGSWVPSSVERVVLKCLSKDPDQRQQSAKEIAQEFDQALKDASGGRISVAIPSNDLGRYTASNNLVINEPSEDAILLTPVEASVTSTPIGRRSDSPKILQQPISDTPVPVKTQQSSNATPGMQAEPVTLQSRQQHGLPFEMEAWMPESIALMKLKGFVLDCAGEILHHSPGLVRVRLNGLRSQSTSWFSFGRRTDGPVEVELHMNRPNPKRENHLSIRAVFCPTQAALLGDKDWRDRCADLFIELRAYLMGGIVT